MATPFTADQPFKENNVINESERSIDPADDVGKIPQLEANGRLHEDFVRRVEEFVFDANGDFTVPDWGEEFIIEVWGAGGSGAIGHGGTDAIIASGGAGGQYVIIKLPAGFRLPGETISVVIGQGGAARTGTISATTGSIAGNPGGTTTFGDIISVPGSPGGAVSARIASPTLANTLGAMNAVSTPTEAVLSPIAGNFRGGFGGAAVGTTSTPGQSTYKQAAGGGGARSGNAGASGGVSEFGGDGGDGNSQINANTTASPGEVPGGGGGGAATNGGTGSRAVTSGAGANGRVKVTVIGKIGE